MNLLVKYCSRVEDPSDGKLGLLTCRQILGPDKVASIAGDSKLLEAWV